MDEKRVYMHVRNEDGSYDRVYPITSSDSVMINGLNLTTQMTEIEESLSSKLDSSKLGKSNGIATLDSNGLVPITQLPPDTKEVRIVENIGQMQSIQSPFQGLLVYVKDATGDVDVKEGGAYYIYDGRQYIKTSTASTMEAVVDFKNIKNLPTTVAGYGITDVVADSRLTIRGGRPNAGKIPMLNADGELDMNVTGRAQTTARLDQKRKITLRGDVSGQCLFDGGENVMIRALLNSQGIRPGTYSKVMVDDRGRIIGVDTLKASDLPILPLEQIAGLENLDDKIMVRDKDQQMENSSIYLDHDPVNNMEATTKRYVDSILIASKLTIKEPVRIATNKNIILSGLQIIDGIQLKQGDRVLVMGQYIKNQNGVYDASDGTWTRSKDLDIGSEFCEGLYIMVNEGQFSNCGYMLINGGKISLGVSDIEFAQFTGPNDLIFGSGLVRDGNTVELEEVGSTGQYMKVVVDKYGRVTKGVEKITEFDIDGGISWANIVMRPNCTPSEIEMAVELMHEHDNEEVLDGLTVNDDGELEFNGKPIITTDDEDEYGVPAGGEKGQVLTKRSDIDYDIGWETASDFDGIEVTDAELQKFINELARGDSELIPVYSDDISYEELLEFIKELLNTDYGEIDLTTIDDPDLLRFIRELMHYNKTEVDLSTLDDAEMLLFVMELMYDCNCNGNCNGGGSGTGSIIDITDITDEELKQFIADISGGSISDDGNFIIMGGCHMPAGGNSGQALVKSSNANYETKWENVVMTNDNVSDDMMDIFIAELIAENDPDLDIDPGELLSVGRLPDGGTIGQMLVKRSNDNYDAKWVDVPEADAKYRVPSGGKTGQMLIKRSENDYDMQWIDVPKNNNDDIIYIDDCKVPSGGKTGQILSKNSEDDYDLEWIDPPKGTGGGGSTSSEDCKVPAGGKAGQMLVKKSGTDYDLQWADVPNTGSGGSGNIGTNQVYSCIGETASENLAVGGIWFKTI